MALDTETRDALIATVRRFVAERLRPLEAQVAENDAIPDDVIAEMKALGLYGLSIPEEYGGLDLSMEDECLVGVELGGALKNIIALSVGICDGLGYGDNAKASIMTRGLAEMARLAVAAGANPLTLAGLAGLGDLIATCSSSLSRNRTLGLELAKGRPLDAILAERRTVAEGVTTTRAALELALDLGVDLPITTQLAEVLFEGKDVRQVVVELMERDPKRELEGMGPRREE